MPTRCSESQKRELVAASWFKNPKLRMRCRVTSWRALSFFQIEQSDLVQADYVWE